VTLAVAKAFQSAKAQYEKEQEEAERKRYDVSKCEKNFQWPINAAVTGDTDLRMNLKVRGVSCAVLSSVCTICEKRDSRSVNNLVYTINFSKASKSSHVRQWFPNSVVGEDCK